MPESSIMAVSYTHLDVYKRQAMGNAEAYVKERAYDLTLSNDEDGVAAAIEKYCF